ncbi:hypothetical protein KKA14_21130 [bacterium]|nr:hypothetical protein [bacterium]
MLKIGSINKLKVKRVTGDEYTFTSGTDDIPLVRAPKGLNIEAGEELDVFVFTDKKGKATATLKTPYAVANEFACLTAIDSNDFGTFLDWGIEVDLFVHQKEQASPMKKGKKHVVFIRIDDHTKRIQGSTYLDQYFETDTSDLRNGESVSLMIYAITEIGIMAVVNKRYSGMLYINECFEKLAIGDIRDGYIKKVREDGRIDLTLQPHIVETITNSKDTIIEKLKEAGGFLPFNDKSNPEEIKKMFSMSKKNFKKALGGLYKDRKIHIAENGISLTRE